ncbi:uncharacterized protein C4orf54 homolog [Neosynchiropus ocellatus]
MLDTICEDRSVGAVMKSDSRDLTPQKSEGRVKKPVRDGEAGGAETRIESRYVDLTLDEVKSDKKEKENEQEATLGTRNEEDLSKTDNAHTTVSAEPCVITHEEGEQGLKPEESDGVDNYLGGKSEAEEDEEADDDEDDDVSLVLSDDYLPFVKEDESHYITTHEILLSELSDHEGDHDLRVGSSASWDIEEGNQVFTFVDYASLEGGGGASRERGPAAAAVSSLLEGDPSPASKFTSSDESKPQQCSGTGQIHLSIRATSRAINDPAGSIHEKGNILYRARRAGDVSHYVWRGVEGAAEGFDKCLIAAPGRVHFGRKGRELTEYSSGTSSAVSELDDADKEVRNLTARTFKSLAYPYFDAINFSTSSESSASEHGINRWSTFVDLKYGNMSHGLDRNPTASFELAKNLDTRGYKGLVLASPKLPELMGKLGQGHGGVIRLTETLNFRCNVKSGMSAKLAGSRSCADEVTRSARSSQRSKPPLRSMEGAHKKAMFASSLIKNVISKKMQFEQERKMERGEISEPGPSGGQLEEAHRGKGGRELHSLTQALSESSSDYAVMCVDELGDIVDSGSCGSRRQDVSSQEPESPASEAAKKGAVDASRSTLLLRSQNSAFRSWKDEELGFQKDHKNDEIAEEKPEGEKDQQSCTKPTKMSRLFVPNIQLCSGEAQEGATQSSGTLSTSKSPEIKINLRSVRDSKTEPFGISRLRAPNLGCKTDESKCQNLLAAARKGESADKVPHFTVRDIRDNSKGKLQTPIHQVRDVRKLVKSSYHFVSLDNNESRTTDSHSEQKKQRAPSSVSPIIIKCQSVNTNSKPPELLKSESLEGDRLSPDGAKAAPPQRPPGRPEEAGFRCDSRTTTKKDKMLDAVGKSSDPKATNMVALEKLQAAVKTMEQLYVFDNNEWKRKNEPQQLLDSHVFSLLATEDHGGPPEDLTTESTSEKMARAELHKTPPTVPASSGLVRQDDLSKVAHGSGGSDDKFRVIQTGASGLKASSSISTKPKTVTQLPFSKSFTPKSPKVPQKTSQIKPSSSEGAGSREKDGPSLNTSITPVDNGNYLTIPVKSQNSTSKTDKAFTVSALSQTTSPPGPSGAGARVQDVSQPSPQSSSITMETRTPEIPSATIYHSLPIGVSPGQQQVYCFSPAITPTPTLDPFQTTQRKMLLDPTTGNYYLVDTPVQPSTRRLFDPETGQYVDVPMPQTPVTPVPMSISPLALSPGAYGHTYMIYPGFMPAPSVIPARTLVQSQMSVHSDSEGGDKAQSQPVEGLYMDSPFYMSTGKSPQSTSGTPSQSSGSNRPAQGFSNVKQPIISITSQQGPRIIAPPSFDGTTMSFVVEHR